MKRYVVSAETPPERLDKAVARDFGLSLRASRTLIAAGRVRVDGRVLAKGCVVSAGQELSVIPEESAADVHCAASIVTRDAAYAALFKPGGVHSVAGRGRDSVEAMLPGLGLSGWMLLNRLDYLTSGLVLAGRNADALARYKLWQEDGLVQKWYLAVAHGDVGPMVLRSRIRDDRRRVVRVLDEQDESVRRTEIRPVARVQNATLVLVRIFMGRRHQIRAHLAAAGHALVGDPVYGQGEAGALRLHHWQVAMPGFTAGCDPDWPELDRSMLETAEGLRQEKAADSR